jgi:hypothetical protein
LKLSDLNKNRENPAKAEKPRKQIEENILRMMPFLRKICCVEPATLLCSKLVCAYENKLSTPKPSRSIYALVSAPHSIRKLLHDVQHKIASFPTQLVPRIRLRKRAHKISFYYHVSNPDGNNYFTLKTDV